MSSIDTASVNSLNWSVVAELGIQFTPHSDAQDTPRLQFPVYAAQASDGTYLIVDELCTEKSVPFRFEYRTIRVDARGHLIFDTADMGIEDGYGCLVAGESAAILRRTKWELLLLSPHGTVTDRIDLTACSKCIPRIVSWTDQDTFLIVFHDRCRRLDVVEIDRQGRLLWYLPSHADFLGVPASVQRLPTNTVLLADAFSHAIVELDRDGNIVWQFGKWASPAKTPDRVSGATCARAMVDGRRLITDTRNHRLLMVEADGTSSEVGPTDGKLSDPCYADANPDGHLLICDSGNARVIEMDDQQRVVWQYGTPIRARRSFCFPRSVEVTQAGEYVIADTANDRIVKVSRGGVAEELAGAEVGLFWPRCVRMLPSGSLLIADGRHGRIIEVAQNGRIVNQLSEVEWDRPHKLQDPHDVRILPNGHLLIADSPQDVVFEADWSGQVHRVIGDDGIVDLADPHSAQQLDDGRVAICDTGHHRLLFVDEQGANVDAIETIDRGSFVLRMNRPRYLEVIPDGTMVITDTGHNRVLVATTTGQLIWSISDVPGSPIPRLYQPRWATLLSRDEVVICDYFHHRIVHLLRETAEDD